MPLSGQLQAMLPLKPSAGPPLSASDVMSGWRHGVSRDECSTVAVRIDPPHSPVEKTIRVLLYSPVSCRVATTSPTPLR